MQAGQYLTATRGFAAPEAQICYERVASLNEDITIVMGVNHEKVRRYPTQYQICGLRPSQRMARFIVPE